MGKPGVVERVARLMDSYVEPRGLRLLALMRGAETLNELAAWKKPVEEVTRKFADAYPEALKQFRAIVGSGN